MRRIAAVFGRSVAAISRVLEPGARSVELDPKPALVL